jgi:CRISPR-associated protein (TIGR02584 family)
MFLRGQPPGGAAPQACGLAPRIAQALSSRSMLAPPARSPYRHVLLAVTGLSPQVVTETLYALAAHDPERLPRELHILTTAEGASRARLMLLSEQPGWFHRLCRDWALPPIAFDEAHIHVLQGPDGLPLHDVRSGADNAAAADQVADHVRRLTADDSTALHVSMAGGRKTLGFFAGYALSLWGRPQDRLSHVLVSEPFESSWEFFYPTPYERVIAVGGGVADCARAQVTLADIPFVRLRSGLPPALLQGQASFAQAVAAAQGHVGPPRLALHLRAQRIVAHGRPLKLAPADLAFLAWFARRAVAGESALPCPKDGVPEPSYAAAYLAEYGRIVGLAGDDERTRRRYRHGMCKTDFEERKSKLKSVLQAALGAAAAPYLIQDVGRQPKCYRLALAPQAIEFDA